MGVWLLWSVCKWCVKRWWRICVWRICWICCWIFFFIRVRLFCVVFVCWVWEFCFLFDCVGSKFGKFGGWWICCEFFWFNWFGIFGSWNCGLLFCWKLVCCCGVWFVGKFLKLIFMCGVNLVFFGGWLFLFCILLFCILLFCSIWFLRRIWSCWRLCFWLFVGNKDGIFEFCFWLLFWVLGNLGFCILLFVLFWVLFFIVCNWFKWFFIVKIVDVN